MCDDGRDTPHAGRNHWQPGGHRLEQRDRKTFKTGREAEHVAGNEDPDWILPIAEEAESLAQAEPIPLSMEFLAERTLPDTDETYRPAGIRQLARGRQHRRVILVGTQ